MSYFNERGGIYLKVRKHCLQLLKMNAIQNFESSHFIALFICIRILVTLVYVMVSSLSGLQIYYLSSSNRDGTDEDCETLGWKRLEEYDPSQRRWTYLSSTVDNNVNPEDDFPFEELEEEDYYPSLPFAALFSCFKVMICMYE